MSDTNSCKSCSSWGKSRDEDARMMWQKTADTGKCYPDFGASNGYPTYESCVSNTNPTIGTKPRNVNCSRVHNKESCGSCQQCLESYNNMYSQNFVDSYNNLDKTWKAQKPFSL
jgi:hypothetical protein